jgi:hypothetical protein
MHNSLLLESVRSAFAYCAVAAAFFFIMTVVAFGQIQPLNGPAISGQVLKTDLETDAIERSPNRRRIFARALDLAHPAKLCSLAGPRRLG